MSCPCSYPARSYGESQGVQSARGRDICGENELPPVGLSPFSVGDTAGAGVVAVVVVVVVVEVDGEGFSLVAHPATTDPIATSAAQPASAILKRLTRFELMINILSFLVELATTKSSG